MKKENKREKFKSRLLPHLAADQSWHDGGVNVGLLVFGAVINNYGRSVMIPLNNTDITGTKNLSCTRSHKISCKDSVRVGGVKKKIAL